MRGEGDARRQADRSEGLRYHSVGALAHRQDLRDGDGPVILFEHRLVAAVLRVHVVLALPDVFDNALELRGHEVVQVHREKQQPVHWAVLEGFKDGVG